MANPSDADRLAIDGGQPALPGGPPPWPPPDDDVRSALEAAYADGSWGRYFGPSGSHLRELLAQRHGVAPTASIARKLPGKS